MHRFMTDLLMVQTPTDGGGDLSEDESAKEGITCKKPFMAPQGMEANRREKTKGYTYRDRETVSYDEDY